MAFNDIRIPRVPSEIFKQVKTLAGEDRIHIHQKALQLIEIGLSNTERHCPYEGYRFPKQSEVEHLSSCELSKLYFKDRKHSIKSNVVACTYDNLLDWIPIGVKGNLQLVKDANKRNLIRVKIDK